MRSFRLSILAVLGALLLAGCSGSGGGHTVTVGNNTSDIVPDSEVGKGKAGKVMTLELSPEMYAVAKSGPASYPAGAKFDDATHSVILKPTSLKGIMIFADGALIGSTDSAGNVRLAKQPTSGQTITFGENFAQPTFGTMGGSAFLASVKAGSLVVPIAVDETKNVQAMDGPLTRDDGDQEGCGSDCGTATFSGSNVTKQPSCCLDYNGTFSSGSPPTDPCDPDTSFLVYPGSTCHKWVIDEVCGHGWQRHVDPSATDRGQCDKWHKGRYCDAINDNAFKVTDSASSSGPSRKVNVGDTVTFTVLNNTRNNETVVTKDKGDDYGTLTGGAELENQGGNTYLLKHYDTGAATHSGFTWVEQRTVTFTAALPTGVDQATVTFVFGQMHPQTISIQVCH